MLRTLLWWFSFNKSYASSFDILYLWLRPFEKAARPPLEKSALADGRPMSGLFVSISNSGSFRSSVTDFAILEVVYSGSVKEGRVN